MANSYEPIVEAFTHVPTDMAHPWLSAAAVAAIAGAGYLGRDYMSRANEQGAVDFRRNATALQASQIGTEKATDKQRRAPAALALAGLALAAVQIGQPFYNVSLPNPNSEVAVVADVSNSMYYGHDVGSPKDTRYSAAIDALKQSKYQGWLGFVQTANSNKIITKPVKNWQPLVKEFAKPQVDPNGGQLIPALERASQVLSEDPHTHQRSGTILVISDGTVNESAQDLTTEASKLQKTGITLRVVVPGTPDGGYILPGTTQTIKAGAAADRFDGFGAHVYRATNVAAINQAVQSQLEASGITREHRNWPVPGALGALALLVALGQFSKRVITRY